MVIKSGNENILLKKTHTQNNFLTHFFNMILGFSIFMFEFAVFLKRIDWSLL